MTTDQNAGREAPVTPLEDEYRLSPRTRRSFADIAQSRLQRRQVLRGGIALAVAGFFGGSLVAGNRTLAPVGDGPRRLGFAAVGISRADTVVVPPGYRSQVLLPWGAPITGKYPDFHPGNSGAEQGMQMGMHHDGMHYFPIEGIDPWRGSSEDGLLVMNHEYIEPRLLHAEAAGQAMGIFDVPLREDGRRDPDQVLKEIHAHGVSVARIRRGSDGQWSLVKDPRNRRVTAATPAEFSGPLRGDPRLVTPYSPGGERVRGTLNNCAHGVTPWNTYLTCEENWWFYFSRQGGDSPPSLTRYGVGRFNAWRWNLAAGDDDAFLRFDASPHGNSAREDYRNEPHGFGWVVEIDPFNPGGAPVKRTHLGRFSHEGVIFAPPLEGKPVVLYSGDDSPFEYIYKFVSAKPYHKISADGSLLDSGTLYAARFNEDGSGEWLALAPGHNGLSADKGFASLADILLNTRGAADVAGATPMDRPEWGAVDPGTGDVYFTLTSNTRRRDNQRNGPNPRANNHFGQIVRWREAGGDHAASRFHWDLFVLAGDESDSRDARGEPLDAENRFAMPDGLWFDPDRRLWIQTDIPDRDQNRGVYAPFGNNAMLAADPDSGEIRRFLTGPIGQEITGCVSTPDQTTLFINIQHPGGGATSAEDFAAGKHASRWPEGGDSYPRSATVAISKEDGGKVGT